MSHTAETPDPGQDPRPADPAVDPEIGRAHV